MPLTQRSPVFRLVGQPDVGDLLRLAAADNPFLPQDQIRDRVVITEQIALLTGATSEAATLLYLWTRTIEDVSLWMGHAAQWLEQYPIWRKVYGFVPSIPPVRMVLAAPGIDERVRKALGLVSCQVTPIRYAYIELDGKAALGWESGLETGGSVIDGIPPARERFGPSPSAGVSDDLTPEELAFFQTG